jgi:transglutaminase-like putative cysteine protease
VRKSRRFETTYAVGIPELPLDARQLEIWAPFPCTNLDQEIHSIEVKTSMSYEVRYDSVYGNAVLHAVASGNDHRSGLKLIICTQASRYERSVCISGYLPEVLSVNNGSPFRAQLAENRLVRFTPEILEISATIKKRARTPVNIAKAAYDHVLENMKYDKTGDGWGQGDAQFACSIGKGNCTDFHSLFLAIVRACGVPGQFEIGMAFPTGMSAGDITAYKCGYHCWTSFYVPAVGWVPVDCSEAAQKPELREYYFGSIDENRFLLSYGRDIELPGRTGRPPINFFTEPVVENQNGKRVDYEKTLTFRNL